MTEASSKEGETRRRERGHDFYPTAEQLAAVPKLYETDSVPAAEKVIQLHYFMLDCDWWLVELDADEWLGFGYACLVGDTDNAEWGYVSLPELENLYQEGGLVPRTSSHDSWRVLPHLIVERDLHWTPQTVSEAQLPGRASL